MPSAGLSLAIYAIVTLVSIAPGVFGFNLTNGFYAAVPFLAAEILLSAAVFITAVSINRPVALLVPLVGVTCGVLITHYTSTQYGDLQRYTPLTDDQLHSAWWIAFRFGVIPLWFASALGLLMADRCVEDSLKSKPRLRLPEPNRVLLWTLASLALTTVSYIASIEIGYKSSLISVILSLLAVPGWIALVLGPAILYKPATAAFSLFPFAAGYYFSIKAGNCGMERFTGSEVTCSPVLQADIAVREALPYVAVFAFAVLCGWWARRPETDAEPAHSGGDSISSSKLPAGSRT